WFGKGVGLVRRTVDLASNGTDAAVEEQLIGVSVDGVQHGMLPVGVLADGLAQADSDWANPGRAGVASAGTGFLGGDDSASATGPSGTLGLFVSPSGAVEQTVTLAPSVPWGVHQRSVAFDGQNYVVVLGIQPVIAMKLSPSGAILGTTMIAAEGHDATVAS